MTSSDRQAERSGHPRPRARLGGALVLAALLPGVFAVALLVSAWLRRPLLARALKSSQKAKAVPLTIAWGIALLGIATVQMAGALAGFGSITSPAGMAARTGFALVAEALLLGVSMGYLARSARAPQLSAPSSQIDHTAGAVMPNRPA